jgi:hypothetical protein
MSIIGNPVCVAACIDDEILQSDKRGTNDKTEGESGWSMRAKAGAHVSKREASQRTKRSVSKKVKRLVIVPTISGPAAGETALVSGPAMMSMMAHPTKKPRVRRTTVVFEVMLAPFICQLAEASVGRRARLRMYSSGFHLTP